MNSSLSDYSDKKDSAFPTESFLSSPHGGGLYIHVPFCRGKCIYCDFYSVGDRIADWQKFTDALLSELNARIKELPNPLTTVYIGGGTPSLMPDAEFLRLCEALSNLAHDVEEFTIEVNPDDVTDEKLQTWKRGGVNRLSMGIQSFDDHMLKTIRRRHNAETAIEAYGKARKEFDNISIDLIFGLPGQTAEMWRDDVRRAISMRPEHISAYSLMYEDGTALTLLRDRGVVEETSEDLSVLMMNILISELRNAGYEHYEISNFALPGYRSRHNSSYWQGYPYLGLGPAAHSYDGMRCRSAVNADFRQYMKYCNDRSSLSADEMPILREYLSAEELREEFIMTRLRMREGIDLDEFRHRFGDKEYKKLMGKSAAEIKDGNLLMTDRHLSLSEPAILISDSVILSLIE